MYLLSFAYLNVRAIHIELVPDMSTHSFVLAFLRLVNIYGILTHVYSDNAKSFVAGYKVLERALVCDEFKEYFQCYNVQHIRIPLFSACVGATWERLIRTVPKIVFIRQLAEVLPHILNYQQLLGTFKLLLTLGPRRTAHLRIISKQ